MCQEMNTYYLSVIHDLKYCFSPEHKLHSIKYFDTLHASAHIVIHTHIHTHTHTHISNIIYSASKKNYKHTSTLIVELPKIQRQ